MAERRWYPTDLSDAEWELIAPLIPDPKSGGRLPVNALNPPDQVGTLVLR